MPNVGVSKKRVGKASVYIRFLNLTGKEQIQHHHTFSPSFFCISVTIQGDALGNRPENKAKLMFNEDYSHWLLITVMSPHSGTFNTVCHSRRATQCREDYQHPLTWDIIRIFTPTDTHSHILDTGGCVGDYIFTYIHNLRQDELCFDHHWLWHSRHKADKR